MKQKELFTDRKRNTRIGVDKNWKCRKAPRYAQSDPDHVACSGEQSFAWPTKSWNDGLNPSGSLKICNKAFCVRYSISHLNIKAINIPFHLRDLEQKSEWSFYTAVDTVSDCARFYDSPNSDCI